MNAYTLSDLQEIMRTLRSENGCPWDREQTHESLKKYLIEECYEANDAVDKKDPQKLAEELGDVLLQIVFHAQIGEESGTFSMDDVLRAVCEKLITRHPHVFGNIKVDTAEQVTENWKAIKQKEHRIESHTQNLMEVPRSMPALMRAQKVQSRAADAGLDFADLEGAVLRLEEEVAELRAELPDASREPVSTAANVDRLTDELGDVLFSVVNVGRFLHLDCEAALTAGVDKFIRRFSRYEGICNERGLHGNTIPSELSDMIWEESKK